MVAPFFPVLAKDCNLTSTEIGVIFGIEPIASFINSIIVAKMMSVWYNIKS